MKKTKKWLRRRLSRNKNVNDLSLGQTIFFLDLAFRIAINAKKKNLYFVYYVISAGQYKLGTLI